MPTGLQIFNDDNTIQIDSSYTNLALLQKITQPMVVSGGNVGESVFTTPASTPFAAIHSTQSVGLRYCRRSGSNFTRFYTSGSRGQNVTLYVFGPPHTSGNTGIQIFDENGVMTFNSNNVYCDIVAVLTANGNVNSVIGNYTFKPNRKYAFALSSSIADYYSETSGNMAPYLFTDVVSGITCTQTSIPAGTVSIGKSSIWTRDMLVNNNQQPFFATHYYGNVLIIDVTNGDFL